IRKWLSENPNEDKLSNIEVAAGALHMSPERAAVATRLVATIMTRIGWSKIKVRGMFVWKRPDRVAVVKVTPREEFERRRAERDAKTAKINF
ncbi:hypothetical protein, partial [Cellulomonas iranensis]|uniref:hypothetical protein n=1 Tax=Cellulomonas iranensis TaxID=76862 RepID=UPI0015C620BA